MINGGGDVDEKCFLLTVVALVSTLVGTQEIGQISGGPLLDRAVAVGGSTLTCSRQSLHPADSGRTAGTGKRPSSAHAYSARKSQGRCQRGGEYRAGKRDKETCR